jgi:hypothetical protein
MVGETKSITWRQIFGNEKMARTAQHGGAGQGKIQHRKNRIRRGELSALRSRKQPNAASKIRIAPKKHLNRGRAGGAEGLFCPMLTASSGQPTDAEKNGPPAEAESFFWSGDFGEGIKAGPQKP